MQFVYVYLAHCLAWFCLAALVAILRGRDTAITFGGATCLGIASASLHITVIYCIHKGYFL